MFELILSLIFMFLSIFINAKNEFSTFIECFFNLLILMGMVTLFKFSPILKSSIKSFKSSIKSTSLTFIIVFIFLFFKIIYSIEEKQTFASFFKITANVFKIFTAAFFEEVLFRGILANLLAFKHAQTKKGAYFTIFFSNFVFGAAHFLNITTGVKFSSVALQALYTFFIGCLITIVYFKCYFNIWVVSIWHTVFNCYGLFEVYFLEKNISLVDELNKENISESLMFYLVFIIILILICLFYLRKNAIEKIVENIKEFKSEFFKHQKNSKN